MPPWGSKWLEREANSDTNQDHGSADTRAQPACTSGQQHGTRWFNVVQGIRRSLDVHLKSYYKVDSAFASTLRYTSATDKLQALVRALTDTGLIDFCCVFLVHASRGTFGIGALSGAGSELYPPQLSEALPGSSSLNVFTRCVFQVQHSNWSVEDVVTSKAPWYYDCMSAVNGFGLPQDGAWLRRVGMRSVLALPCIHGNEVTGVLAVASKQKTLDHLLLRKLEELCFKVTPVVTDAVAEHALLLCNRRVAGRYESISDFAHEVLGEMLNLDRAVAVSAGNTKLPPQQPQHPSSQNAANNHSCRGVATAAAAPAMSVRQEQQQQLLAATAAAAGSRKVSCSGGRGWKAEERFDAAAAVAAAAAAGFSWTAPTATAPTVTPASAAAAAAAAALVSSRVQAVSVVTSQSSQPQPQTPEQPVPPCAQPSSQGSQQTSEQTISLGAGDSSYCSVVTAAPTGLMTSDISSAPLHTPAATTATTDLSGELQHLREAASAAAAPTSAAMDVTSAATSEEEQEDRLVLSATAAQQQPQELRLVHAGLARSLPTQKHANKATEYLLRIPEPAVPARCLRRPQQSPAQPRCGSTAVSSDRNVSRSNRSLSCLEFSGASAVHDPRDAFAHNSCSNVDSAVAAACTGAMFAAVTPASKNGAPACAVPAVAPVLTASVCLAPGCSNRSTESGSGEPFMLETMSTEELARTPQGGFMSVISSHNTDRRTIHRVAPLEQSVGRAGCTVIGSAPCSSRDLGPCPAGSVSAAAAVIAGAPFSSGCGTEAAGTDCTSTCNTNTTFGYTYTTGATTCTAAVATSSRLSGLVAANALLSSGEAAANATGMRTSRADGDCGEESATAGDAAGLVGRWSRDSAAAAAAVWSNEAAEAFAAAMRFTASHASYTCRAGPTCGGRSVRGSSTSWSSPSHQAASSRDTAAASHCDPPFNVASAFGGLYGIRESGPVPSLALSLDTSGSSLSGDFGLAVMDMASAGFILSSSLGAEAQQRHYQAQGSLSQSPPSGKLALAAEQQWVRTRVVRS